MLPAAASDARRRVTNGLRAMFRDNVKAGVLTSYGTYGDTAFLPRFCLNVTARSREASILLGRRQSVSRLLQRWRVELPDAADNQAWARAIDAGTFWSMRRGDRTARCVGHVDDKGWDMRIVVDDYELLRQRVYEPHEPFTLAERWRARMADVGWTIAPVKLRARPDRRGLDNG